MSVAVTGTDQHLLNLRTRMPFRYGIAALKALPHMFLSVQLNVDGRVQRGVAADSLPPKWFTKDPDTPYREDLEDMLCVIESACGLACEAGTAPTVFDLWQSVYAGQKRWAEGEGYPPLLWGFGVSLVERAIIDAFCRATGTTFATALRKNALGIRPGDAYAELEGVEPAELLPAQPLCSIVARHTVGLGDPLTDDEIAETERLDDGLPQSLQASIVAYGLTHFKLKLCGDKDSDLDRLRHIAVALDRFAPPEYRFTLDGNEQYRSIRTFREFWDSVVHDPALASFLSGLLFVEQPLHRDITLSDETGAELAGWHDRPPIIIDESDAEIGSLPAALERGYAGTSHKNCKGVFKGIVNACLIEHRRRQRPDAGYILSGEDLTNVGPVALLEDLAVMASLGIEHLERNGQHYFTGLSLLPEDVQASVVSHHDDLYRWHERGYATVDIRDGAIQIGSVVDAPFGVGFEFDPSRFTPLRDWNPPELD